METQMLRNIYLVMGWALPPISEPTDFGKDKPTSRCQTIHLMWAIQYELGWRCVVFCYSYLNSWNKWKYHSFSKIKAYILKWNPVATCLNPNQTIMHLEIVKYSPLLMHSWHRFAPFSKYNVSADPINTNTHHCLALNFKYR